jgi:hypothetical protein
VNVAALFLVGDLCVRHADVILAQSTAAGTPLDIHGIQSLPPGTLFAVPANIHSLTATPGMARGYWRISLLCVVAIGWELEGRVDVQGARVLGWEFVYTC